MQAQRPASRLPWKSILRENSFHIADRAGLVCKSRCGVDHEGAARVSPDRQIHAGIAGLVEAALSVAFH